MISDILPQLIRFSGISESAHNLYCLHNHFTIYDTLITECDEVNI